MRFGFELNTDIPAGAFGFIVAGSLLILAVVWALFAICS
jgi:hypothetical protein